MAIGFPLIVLIGYFKSYYFSAFFDVKPLANALVHAHGIVMSTWVLYFVAQVALVRSKNMKLHMSIGIAGIALAAIVVVVGMATAWDAHMVRGMAPAGIVKNCRSGWLNADNLASSVNSKIFVVNGNKNRL